MYDAIIVGSRCAGAPTGMLLARAGYRVLILDSARFPKDTLSTHLIWPWGASYLNRWRLFDELKAITPTWELVPATFDGIHLQGRVPVEAVRERLEALHGNATGAVGECCSPRRIVLDDLLKAAAVVSGAEVREEFTVDDLVVTDGKVVGIRGREPGGATVTERARVVIGADGRNSLVARRLKVPKLREREKCTFCYYTYYSGDTPPKQLHGRGRLAVAVSPTNHDCKMVLVMGPVEWFHAFRRDIEGNFHKACRFVAPELDDQLRQSCRREEPFRGSASMPTYYRRFSGPGWALVGDAAYATDQCTAVGMTHAFRGAELLAAALHQSWSGDLPTDVALAGYAETQTALAEDYFDYVADRAEMNLASRDKLKLMLAIKKQQRDVDRYIGTVADTVSPKAFFAPDNLERLKGAAAPADCAEIPALRDYDALTELNAAQPF